MAKTSFYKRLNKKQSIFGSRKKVFLLHTTLGCVKFIYERMVLNKFLMISASRLDFVSNLFAFFYCIIDTYGTAECVGA